MCPILIPGVSLVAQADLLLRSLVALPPAGVVVLVSVLGGLSRQSTDTKAAEAISCLYKIADTNTPIQGMSGNFTDFSDPSISDNVVFAATGAGIQSGIYTNIKRRSECRC